MSQEPNDHYLNAIGREPLLTAKEEILLSRMVQRRLQLLELSEGDSEDRPTEEWAARAGLSLMDLSVALRRGMRARNRMIRANMRLAIAEANKARHYSKSMAFADLMQEACMGLARAVEKFDATRGYKFSTYAYWWVRQAIKRQVAYQDEMIRIPIHLRDGNHRARMIAEAATREGRKISAAEIAKQAGLNLESWQASLAARQIDSLNRMVGSEEETQLLDCLAAEATDSWEEIDAEQARQDVQELIPTLEKSLGSILVQLYGLDGSAPKTLPEIAKQFGVSRERIRQKADKGRRVLAQRLLNRRQMKTRDGSEVAA